MTTPKRLLVSLLTVAFAMVMPGISIAQDDFSGNVFPSVTLGGFGDNGGEPASWSAKYYAAEGKGQLVVEATLNKPWHVYSVTQDPAGPSPTVLSISGPDTVKLTGKFVADSEPDKSVSDIYKDVTIEEHSGTVAWTAPIELPTDFQSDIAVTVAALACKTGTCVPIDVTLSANFAGKPPAADTPAPVSASLTDKPQSTGSMPGMLPSSGFLPGAGLTPGGDSSADLLRAWQDQVGGGPSADADPAIADLPAFRNEDYQVEWKAWTSASIAAGETGFLRFMATPDETFHVYAAAIDDAKSATNFVVTEKSGLRVMRPEPDQEVITNKPKLPPGVPDIGLPAVSIHEGTVTWTLPIQVPAGHATGEFPVTGMIAYQACNEGSCMVPEALKFAATITVGDATDATPQAVQLTAADSDAAMELAGATKWVDQSVPPTDATTPTDQTPDSMPSGPSSPDSTTPDTTAQASVDNQDREPKVAIADAPRTTLVDDGNDAGTQSMGLQASINAFVNRFGLPAMLAFAFVGGLILNLMPCVLPVVGLKVMSFVSQAGEDRKRVLLLNLAYVGGILLIFALLTVLAVFLSFSWGEQFTYWPVRLGLTLGIFALALSYLGVWEIPAPGMAAGKTSQELQSREGLTGAFFKGAFTTVMATPCSGPLLGIVLGFTTTLSPMATMLVMMTVGLGMASPYVVLGIFPSLIRFLPKPGDWMVTLKEFLAFLFLATVAYFFNQFSDGEKLPVFVALIGVWFGCWIIGKVPAWETINKRLLAWGSGIASAILIGILSFSYLATKPPIVVAGATGNAIQYVAGEHIQWEPFNPARLEQLQAEGKTVMLDFTAKWCVNCIFNSRTAIDTETTLQRIKELDAIPMLADWTDRDKTIKNKLDELNSKSIPLLAIYPGATPDKPIILRDIVTQKGVLNALEAAGPSVDKVAVRK
ncbi:cytochrome c biogenesis protein CcdA [Stieleria varia]|uniref:Thiol:disulfide interchange protein DsbD n=1 Tax=Stieleria varia TaxID=2528005 RepID=A0A5C6B0A6_9BACT|nr:thioredoxin family protein [Stieleria varia]TWU04716.1 Thiol:disulfide interchange protein DsbD precursor [Stieleria varia]